MVSFGLPINISIMPIYLFACIYVDKLKSRLMDNLTGLPSTKMHVDNEKDRLIKNAHIIAEVKARNAEEAAVNEV